MSLLRFHTLDVFCKTPFQGNPLAVVLGAELLDGAQMQAIAREFKLSETVFVLSATDNNALLSLRIFTPLEELPFAGHPLIGTACLLAEKGLAPPGDEVSFALEVAGRNIEIQLRREPDELAFAEISAPQAPVFSAVSNASEAIANALDLDVSAVGGEPTGPIVSDCGLPMLLIPLTAPEHLAGVNVDYRALAPILARHSAHSAYVYARGYEGEWRGRMFSPGIGEDPATGSAALALAARLASEESADGELQWKIRQGIEMGRASELFVRAVRRQGQCESVRVGGYAVPVMEGHLTAY